MTTTLDWERVIDRCVAGDRTAWESLVESTHFFVLSILRRRIGEDETARDLTQEVYGKLLADDCRRLRDFDPGRKVPFLSYLRVITVNLSIDWSRGRQAKARKKHVDLEDLLDTLTVEPDVDRNLAIAALREAVEKLPEHERAAVQLTLEGMKTREIARVMGMSDGGVSALLHRARGHLRDLLEGGWGDSG